MVSIKSQSCNRLAQNLRTVVMQESLQTQVKLTYVLMKLSFKGKMIFMSSNLNEEDLRQLRYYLEGFIPVNSCSDAMDIVRLLENDGRISWENVKFIKKAMESIRRQDIVKELTKFEIKRNLTLLLDFYTKNVNGLDSNFCENKLGMKMIASLLQKIMDTARESVNVRNISSTVESSRDLKKVLMTIEEKLDEEPSLSWNDFTMLVILAGEIIAIASADEEQQESLLELCITAADELCSRMNDLGTWEDFKNHVK